MLGRLQTSYTKQIPNSKVITYFSGKKFEQNVALGICKYSLIERMHKKLCGIHFLMLYLVYDAKDFPQSIDIRDIGTTKISVVYE